MRIPARAAAVLAAVLAASAARPAAAQEASAILLLVQPVEGYDDANALVEPIALLDEGYYEDPVMDLNEEFVAGFNARWFGAGRQYGVLSRGADAGTATVVAPDEPGCNGIGARVRLAPARAEGWHGLAGHGLPRQPPTRWVRDATAQERRALDRLAAALFAAHGVDVASRPDADTSVAAVLFGGIARPVLVGSYTLATEDEANRQASAFIVAEEGQSGYRPAFVSFHEARVMEGQSRELLDAADLDGDSRPDLVLRNSYWESWDFSILKRDEHGWDEVYHGGGAGC